MPTYDYECEKCKKGFEVYQSMKDEPLAVCPKELCRQKTWGKGKVKRQVGAGAGLIFKGSGFYLTDYRSEGYKTAERKDKPASAEPAKSEKSESKSETKAEPKTDAKPAAKPAASEKSKPSKKD